MRGSKSELLPNQFHFDAMCFSNDSYLACFPLLVENKFNPKKFLKIDLITTFLSPYDIKEHCSDLSCTITSLSDYLAINRKPINNTSTIV